MTHQKFGILFFISIILHRRLILFYSRWRWSGSIRADEKRRLSSNRNKAIEPYENLKLSIDDMITQIESGKIRFEKYISENKTTSEKSKSKKSNKKEILEQIEKLGELRIKNIVSEEEFQSKKSELLSRI